jgi:hypothetical protein
MREILGIADAVIGEPALPDFSLSPKDASERVGVATFDELNCMLERDVMSGSEQEMNVLGHQNESMKLVSPFATISVNGLEE